MQVSSESASGERSLTPAQLESQQQSLARQQRRIVRFQKVTIIGGLGWATLQFATGANGPVWTARNQGRSEDPPATTETPRDARYRYTFEE